MKRTSPKKCSGLLRKNVADFSEKMSGKMSEKMCRTSPSYIYKTIYVFLSTTNAYWLRVNHTSNLPGFKPQTRKECLQDPLTRKECLHTRAQGGERGEEKRGRVREPQRLGLSQGTMNREPKYWGGAHPKYRSCRRLVSLIPRTCISGCPHEVLVVRRRRS